MALGRCCRNRSAYNGVKLSRTVVRVPEVDKFSKEAMAEVRATPWALHEAKKPEVVFRDKVDVDRQYFAEKTSLARRVYLRASDFDEHGMTRGCPKCDHFLKHNSWGTRPHSSACRARITAELVKTEGGRIRIGMAAERLDKTVEHLGQQFREDLPQGENVEQPEQPVVVSS